MSDPVAAAAAVMAKGETFLLEVRQARIALAATAESPERTAYLGMLESFERGLLAAFEDVVAELQTLRGGHGVATAAARRARRIGRAMIVALHVQRCPECRASRPCARPVCRRIAAALCAGCRD